MGYPVVTTDDAQSMGISWNFRILKWRVLYHIRPHSVGIFPYIGLI
jgi:hypothetical protein